MSNTVNQRRIDTQIPDVGVRRVSLDGVWSLAPADLSTVPAELQDRFPVAAHVPGCVHDDLIAAQVIADPYVGDGERACEWVARTDWRFRRRIQGDSDVTDGSTVELVFEGIDTVAEVCLNDEVLGTVCDMHLLSRFDVTDRLRPGDNILELRIKGAFNALEQFVAEHGELPHEGHGSNPHHPHNSIRKMACAYGWDWGPVVPTSGLWKPARMEIWREARLDCVRPLVRSANEREAVLEVYADLAGEPSGCQIRVRLDDPDGLRVAELASDAPEPCTIVLERPRLWWPRGYGEQPLYRLTCDILRDGVVIDSRSCRVGFREVAIERLPDAPDAEFGQGESFAIRVNGRTVYCKGANWIPDDVLPSRMTGEIYAQRVGQAADCNMNMLRVWGGGLYESDEFYDVCDELGMLVWQDFACGCAAYHEHEPYRSLFEAEARQHVARLAGHPSLAIWCGNNECQSAVWHWGPFERIKKESVPWGELYYESVFPAIVFELDGTRPYWPGSAYSGSPEIDPDNELFGDIHIWDVWNGEGAATNYLSHTPRFASEFGFHGPPSWPTLERVIPIGERRFDSPAMVRHNRHKGGQQLADVRLQDYFASPDDFNDWHYLAQVVQARSLTLGCEWFRALYPWCTGSLYWQLNDCWPVASWAAIDGDGRPKPLWYATRRFYRPRLLTILPTSPLAKGDTTSRYSAYMHNDSDSDWSGTLVVEIRSVETGCVVREVMSEPTSVDRRAVTKVDLPPVDGSGLGVDPATEFLVATLGDERALAFLAPDHDLAYAPAQADYSLEQAGDDIVLTIRARNLVRDLCVFADRLDPGCGVSDQLITLLPGDSASVRISPSSAAGGGLDLASLTATPVMQCANRFGRTL